MSIDACPQVDLQENNFFVSLSHMYSSVLQKKPFETKMTSNYVRLLLMKKLPIMILIRHTIISIMNESFSLELLYTDQNIQNELFQLVQSHSCSQLDTRLHQLSNPTHYLKILTDNYRQQVTLLMAAASYGYDDIVRMLLAHDNTADQVEVKGQIIISDGRTIDGATALYCACYHGHFTIAKTLIEVGHANVNQDTDDYPYYPLLLHATILNRRNIVDFLLENNYADINETKSCDADQWTALVWAAFCGHTSLVEHFIAMGADINYICENQSRITLKPLGFALLGGHIDVVQLLYHAGANTNIIEQDRDDILTNAVQENALFIIDFLLEQSISTVEQVELTALSSIRMSSSIEQLQTMLDILKVIIRWRERSNTLKARIEPIAAYDYQQECQTVDELDSIRNDRDRIFVEILLILERIALSRNDITIVKPLHYCGDILVERKQFERCLNLWIHMFYLYQKMKMSTILHRFVWLFCRMLTANEKIPVDWFLRVGRLVFEPSHLKEKTFNCLNAFMLVIIATKV